MARLSQVMIAIGSPNGVVKQSLARDNPCVVTFDDDLLRISK